MDALDLLGTEYLILLFLLWFTEETIPIPDINVFNTLYGINLIFYILSLALFYDYKNVRMFVYTAYVIYFFNANIEYKSSLYYVLAEAIANNYWLRHETLEDIIRISWKRNLIRTMIILNFFQNSD